MKDLNHTWHTKHTYKNSFSIILSLLYSISVSSCVLFSETACAQEYNVKDFQSHLTCKTRCTPPMSLDEENKCRKWHWWYLDKLRNDSPDTTALRDLTPGVYVDKVNPFCAMSKIHYSDFKQTERAQHNLEVKNALTLIDAIEKGNLQTVMRFIPRHAHPNTVIPKQFAIFPHENPKSPEEWLGIKVNDITNPSLAGRSFLNASAKAGHSSIVDYLIAQGASADSCALAVAAQNANLEIFDKLLTAGADIKSTCVNGSSMLHYAAEGGNTDIISKVLAAGVDVNVRNNNGVTPLHNAAMEGYVSALDALIAAGADVNARANNGVTPLHNAAFYGFLFVTNALIAAGADVNARANNGVTPLHNAALYDHVSADNRINVLIAAGADVNARANNGDTPLHNAAINGHVPATNVLIAAGADIYAVAKDGTTPHTVATKKRHTSVLKALFDAAKDADDSTNISNFNKQLDVCRARNITTDEQDREKAKQLTIEYLKKKGYENTTEDKIIRTKAYADQFEINYQSVKKQNSDPNKDMRDYEYCVKQSIQSFPDHRKLPIIYNYCKGSEIAWSGSIGGDAQSPDPIPPETILTSNEFSFKNCIESFAIYNYDYVTSKEYFLNRLQEDYNRFSKEAKKVRKDIAKAKKKSAEQRAAAAKKAEQNFIYWNSPRGKCESRCNQQYKKNTSMWSSCMDLCKDMRSDILDY